LTHTPRHPDGCWALTGAALYDLAAGRFQGCTERVNDYDTARVEV
jgi:hypothetical protein